VVLLQDVEAIEVAAEGLPGEGAVAAVQGLVAVVAQQAEFQLRRDYGAPAPGIESGDDALQHLPRIAEIGRAIGTEHGQHELTVAATG
jgi:hypothetical protein